MNIFIALGNVMVYNNKRKVIKMIKFEKEKFSIRLSELMKNNGDTVYTLADAVHVTPGTISKYVNGKIEPRRPTIEAIALKYNINPVWLMGIEGVSKYLEDATENYRKIAILGTIAAGQPLLAEEYTEGYEYVSEKSKADFCLRIRGDSMTGARIYDGDIAFIRQQPDVENGEIAAVIIDGENATLKRVYKINGSVILHAENPKYTDMVFSKKDFREVKIVGKCIAVKFWIE